MAFFLHVLGVYGWKFKGGMKMVNQNPLNFFTKFFISYRNVFLFTFSILSLLYLNSCASGQMYGNCEFFDSDGKCIDAPAEAAAAPAEETPAAEVTETTVIDTTSTNTCTEPATTCSNIWSEELKYVPSTTNVAFLIKPNDLINASIIQTGLSKSTEATESLQKGRDQVSASLTPLGYSLDSLTSTVLQLLPETSSSSWNGPNFFMVSFSQPTSLWSEFATLLATGATITVFGESMTIMSYSYATDILAHRIRILETDRITDATADQNVECLFFETKGICGHTEAINTALSTAKGETASISTTPMGTAFAAQGCNEIHAIINTKVFESSSGTSSTDQFFNAMKTFSGTGDAATGSDYIEFKLDTTEASELTTGETVGYSKLTAAYWIDSSWQARITVELTDNFVTQVVEMIESSSGSATP